MKTIAEKVMAGQPLDNILVIDAHCHIGHSSRIYMPKMTPEYALSYMDRFGIDKMCVSSIEGIYNDCIRANEEAATFVSACPERLMAYCIVNGNYPEEGLALLDEYLDKPGFIGAKLYPGEGYGWSHHDIALDDPRFDAIYDKVAEAGKCVLAHTWECGGYKAAPGKMRRALERHPEMTVIVGHSGGTYDGHFETMAMMRDFPNVYFDLTGTEFGEIWLRDLVEMVDNDRILYGSDAGFLDAGFYIGKIGLAGITEEQKRKIFGGNMQRLLKGLNL